MSSEDKSPAARASSSSFDALRKQCLTNGCLFEDPEFPAVDRSINTSKPISKHISWKRPSEFCKNPQFVVGGQTRFDLDQGALGNCWFIAAAATLATKPQLMQIVVPTDQSFTDNYAGLFHFYFWRYGVWTEVIIDDRLPVKYGNQLEFCHNKEEPDEFWSALLEKAYAKLNGSYEALLGGNIQDAMVDLTGGVSETIDLREKAQTNDILFGLMQRFETSNSLMGCSILVLGKSGSEPFDNGLLSGHAYSITGLSKITSGNNKEVRLIRLLNPWGKTEWSGAWSDSSKKWNDVSDETKKQLQFRALEDGEFWMSFDEWKKTFTELQFCHLTSHSFNSKVDWRQQSVHGSWVKGVNAGGCGIPPNEQFYWNNPQYCIVIGGSGAEAAEASSSSSSSSSSPIIISLMQKDKRETNKNNSNNNFTIGFRLFLIRRNEPVSLDNTIFPKETVTLEHGVYNQFREVSQHYNDISTGVYCIIPTTYRPDEEAMFFLRILTQQQAELREPIKRHGMVRLARMEMPVARLSMGYGTLAAPPMVATDGTVPPEVEEPLMTAVSVKQLGRSPPRSDDTVDRTVTMTPAEREIFEIYEDVINSRHFLSSENIDPDLLQQILSSLNDIGQLGCYRLNFCRADSRVFFSLLQSFQERRSNSFDQIRNLVGTIKEWVKEFAKHDRNYTEFLPFIESWEAFSSLGYQLSNDTKEVIVLYHGADQHGGLYVSDFISCTAKLSATRLYWATKTQEESSVISFEELLQRVLMT